MKVELKDLWTLGVQIDGLPLDNGIGHVVFTAVQPHGYSERFELDVELQDGSCGFEVRYPLIDDGCYVGFKRNWPEPPKLNWPTGRYVFTARIQCAGSPPHSTSAEIAIEDLYANAPDGGPATDSIRQFLQCSPYRPIVVDHDRQGFFVRTLGDEVVECQVEIDVVLKESSQPLAGPWRIDVGRRARRRSFSTKHWPSGQYWIRLRTIRDDKPLGPYCIRVFLIESSVGFAPPPDVLRAGTATLPAVDNVLFEKADGVQFVPDPLEKKPDAPLITPEHPWEGEMLDMFPLEPSLRRNEESGYYEMLYKTRTGDAKRAKLFAGLEHAKCLAISRDGLIWEKPQLGKVMFQGSTANNIVSNDPGKSVSGKHDVASEETLRELEHAQFRYYDAGRDGPVNLDNVFLHVTKRGFPVGCRSMIEALNTPEPQGGDDLVRIRPGRYYAFEKRGDDYIVLNREPLAYSGAGLSAKYTTETCRFHVELESTKRLFFYYRPTMPAYSPNWAPYDNLIRGRRTLAMLWTDDGLSWERRFVLSPDEFDEPGTVLYAMRVIAPENTAIRAEHERPAMSRRAYAAAAVTEQPIYLGTVLLYNVVTGRLRPELIWTTDLIRWHRFPGKRRRPFIEPGPYGSYNWGWVRDQTANAYEFDGEWWFPYWASNTLHSQGRGARAETIEDLKRDYGYYARYPHFTTWENMYKEVKTIRRLPAMARTKPWRLLHAEPIAEKGTITSKRLVVGGDAIEINAAVEPGGSVTVELRDEAGRTIDGRALGDCEPFRGDQIDHIVRWRQRENDIRLAGRTIIVHFVLDRARLYAFGFRR